MDLGSGIPLIWGLPSRAMDLGPGIALTCMGAYSLVAYSLGQRIWDLELYSDRLMDRSLDRSIVRSFSRSIARSLDRSIADSIARSLARSLVRSLDHSIDRSIDRSLDRSTAPSIARPPAMIIVHACIVIVLNA